MHPDRRLRGPDPSFPAKTVAVDKIFRARCAFCQWRGGEHPDYAGANGERQEHLEWHRTGGGDG